ncbi:MAG: hypothetical protein AAF298_11700 [Cyanobacteria bacterium P01_A01_bin.40]
MSLDRKNKYENVSLVAFYGHKPPPLINLIQKLQEAIANHSLIQNQFIPYQLKQVHGTIIGCEGIVTESGIISHWFHYKRRENRYLDFAGLIDYLHNQINFPLTIRLGGYNRQQEYNFHSREQHLYLRSFQLQESAEQTIPVLIGWSWRKELISLEIDNLRRNLQQFNLLHKYHDPPEAVDNDFYLRLGTINSRLTSPEREAVATDLRNLLETQPALDIPINLPDLAFAQYQDLLLTPATTKIFPVGAITAKQLEELYFESVNNP